MLSLPLSPSQSTSTSASPFATLSDLDRCFLSRLLTTGGNDEHPHFHRSRTRRDQGAAQGTTHPHPALSVLNSARFEPCGLSFPQVSEDSLSCPLRAEDERGRAGEPHFSPPLFSSSIEILQPHLATLRGRHAARLATPLCADGRVGRGAEARSFSLLAVPPAIALSTNEHPGCEVLQLSRGKQPPYVVDLGVVPVEEEEGGLR
jgi:hypothetical protein